ncbi:RNA-directed DNA polymerase from mobile element jockey-like protein [Willisornis vidua]|uniref:RNA-directed DNA polymerase from mobile element jockey-like protein n=1 Tax=Willisornis vidua TaxID=1566151 RepID=A0ABQ9DID5_9PASS|nr:RNA-directed DNA polymerase from mobile element jockey-like protein [Willisornis vidua]
MIIFERSWRTEEVPENWKKPDVTPVFKTDKEDLGNYQPASLTPIPGKVMECLFLEAIPTHMEDNVIRSSQHALTKGKSCLTNLMAFYDEKTTWMDERAVDIVYLDVSKAFNTVSNNILIGKLKKCDLDEWTVRWIGTWINSRSQGS